MTLRRKFGLALCLAIVLGGMSGLKSLYDDYLGGKMLATRVAATKGASDGALTFTIVFVVLALYGSPLLGGTVTRPRPPEPTSK